MWGRVAFSWIDLIAVGLIIQGFFSKELDFVRSFLKLLGLIFATVITLHYCLRFGGFASEFLSLPEENKEIIGFILLSTIPIFLFYRLCDGWKSILDLKVPENIGVNFSKVFNVFRAVLLSGLLIIALIICKFTPITASARTCLSSKVLREISINVYGFNYNVFIKNFFSQEPFNQDLINLIEGKMVDKSIEN
jgi:hypothetical protein